MGRLTTHVLDTAQGCPAAGLALTLSRLDGARYVELKRATTNSDVRCDGPLREGSPLAAGRYPLEFNPAAYFRPRGFALPDPPFLDRVTIDFGVADPAAHYHVPLLLSPWSYSTYRGS